MARGWESKSVEEQVEEASRESTTKGRPQLSADEQARLRQKTGLQLALTKILGDLQNCINERHRAMLEAAKTDLEEKLSRL